MADDRLRSPDAKVCQGQEYVPGRRILRASAAASVLRAAQQCLQFQSPALPRIGPAREKLRRAREAGNRACFTILSLSSAPGKLDRLGMKRILVPIDFSDVTPPVINLARQLAKALDAEIHLIHVKELTPTAFAAGMLESGLVGMPELAPVSGVPAPGFDSMPQTIPESDSQKSQLVQWQKEIEQAGIKVTMHQPTGAVAEEILNQADALNADLIVMGRHGHGAMYHLLVGSATEGVLRHATRPVLLVPVHKSS
jgi:nucleotide-binding universal stress UspA family protein